MHAKTRSLILRGTVAFALVALMAAPAAAQNHRAALGLGGGWSRPGDMTPGMGWSTTLEPGWVAGLQMESWPASGRIGFRLGGTFMERALQEDPASRYAALSADLAFLVRLLPAGRVRWVAPYLALGGGGTGYMALDGGPFAGVYGDDPVVRAQAIAGGGFDLLPSNVMGLRLEAIDRIMLPSLGEGPESVGLPTVHAPELTAALQIRGGMINKRPVYLAATPPAPAPAAARPRVEETPAAAPDRAELEAARAESEQLRGRLAEWQGQVVSLNTRVDSLERALASARAATPPAGPMGTPVAAAAPAAAPAAVATPVAPRSAVRSALSDRHVAAAGAMFTVQVGAFVEEATAYRWEERLRSRSIPVWVTPAEVRGQRVTRVRVGALPTQEEADALARMLQAEGWPVWVDRVADGEGIPADAVAATRSFIRSGN